MHDYHLCPLNRGTLRVIAIAGLRPPTHRRSLVLTKEVLGTWGQIGLQEEFLAVYGCANFNQAQVETYLQKSTLAFDIAAEVTQTPIPFGHKLHPYVKPYLVEGTQEMIDAGYHREAMLWIHAFLWISTTAIQIDAPEAQKPQFQKMINQLTSDLGLSTSQDIGSRYQQAKELTDKIFKVADVIVHQNPEIME